MCRFFSFLSNGKGKYYFIKGCDRRKVWESGENPDSHSFIVKFYQDKGELAIGNTVEDKLNKYEYYICEGGFKFHIDAINTKDDSEEAEEWVQNMFHPDNIDYDLFDSEWAYWYCEDIKDTKEMRDRITDSIYAYWYCKIIKDTKEMRDRITDHRWIDKYREHTN